MPKKTKIKDLDKEAHKLLADPYFDQATGYMVSDDKQGFATLCGTLNISDKDAKKIWKILKDYADMPDWGWE